MLSGPLSPLRHRSSPRGFSAVTDKVVKKSRTHRHLDVLCIFMGPTLKYPLLAGRCSGASNFKARNTLRTDENASMHKTQKCKCGGVSGWSSSVWISGPIADHRIPLHMMSPSVRAAHRQRGAPRAMCASAALCSAAAVRPLSLLRALLPCLPRPRASSSCADRYTRGRCRHLFLSLRRVPPLRSSWLCPCHSLVYARRMSRPRASRDLDCDDHLGCPGAQ